MLNKDFWKRVNKLEELAAKASKDDVIAYIPTDKSYKNQAEYVNAAHPAMILEMIAEMRRLETVVNGYKVSTEEAQEIMGELQAKNARLEKEADWLAERLKEACKNFNGCFSCPFYDDEGAYCIVEDKTWREAARKAVAKQEVKMLTTEELFARLRKKRDELLQRHECANPAYKQALRDLPAQPGAPWDGGGPETPWPNRGEK